MTKDEGVAALFRGVWPNTLRAALMTASQLATYDQFKSLLMASGMCDEGLTTHFTV
jgi:dicarboxylate transporter 10